VELKPKNDPQNPVSRFCLAMEELRRTEAGRVKDATELLAHFFPHDASRSTDRLFLHMPQEVRAPIVSAWGIRGAKAALRDDDEKIRTVVHDALLAGDIDEATFEDGLGPDILVGWVPLPDWCSFWRSGKVVGVPVQRALDVARQLGLFDDRWFLQNLDGRGGRLKGTDTICDTLGKDQIVAWLQKMHASGDGSPAGIVAAIGWDVVLARTAQEALLFALDALATKIGLVQDDRSQRMSEVPGVSVTDFPIEERGTDDAPLSNEANDESWPEVAQPGDMGYALAKGPSIIATAVKPHYNLDQDEEHTSEVNMGPPPR